MIRAKVVADSLSPQGERLTSLLITAPRFILAEINTHRMLSKNTSSSRAIPFLKMVEIVRNNPFIPIAWQKDHKGMQGNEYFTEHEQLMEFGSSSRLRSIWLEGRDAAVEKASALHTAGVTKQLCNRLLEPYMWTTMLITGSKEGWDNFFELRCPQYEHHGNKGIFYKSKKDFIKDYPMEQKSSDLFWLQCNKGQAEIHMMALAEAIYDARGESITKQLKAGEWHIPFRDKMDMDEVYQLVKDNNPSGTYEFPEYFYKWEDIMVKISTAMAARTSYTVVGDEKEINYQKMIELHDRLIIQKPLHASPMEHCARAMDDSEYMCYTKTYYNPEKDSDHDIENGWCRNYKGFIQYRHILETQNQY